MYPSHHHHPKRRKKRPIHGVKTVDVTRGKSGYGFTISGQHPCVLSYIVSNSSADKAGLRPGDYLVSINGVDISKSGHDEVARMVGLSMGTLTIQIAENYNSSDSSDDEYTHRVKTKYPNRAKRSQRYSDKMDKLLSDINHRDRCCPDGHSHDPNARPLQAAQKHELPRSRSSRPRLHTPVGAENHEILAEGRSYIEAGATNVFKVPFQKSVSASNVAAASSLPMHHRVEPKQAFIKSTSQGHVQLPSNQPSRIGDHHYSNFSPTSLQQIINHSLHSYSAANEAFILDDDLEDDDDDHVLNAVGTEINVVVGYIGSLEMPGDASQPHVRIQSIRNAVRRLRVEKKIHTLVLMTVASHGVKLTNSSGTEIAIYPVRKLAFSGVCPDDRRFFGIVTSQKSLCGSGSDSESPDEGSGSSCHVFMVDPEMTSHSVHSQKAKTFRIECSVDPHTQRCSEFPRSTTPIILSISNLYKDRASSSLESDVARSHVFANPNHAIQHSRSSSSSSSNSDSGLGLCRDDGINERDRAVVIEMPPPPVPERQPLPERQRHPQLPQVKWSGNTVHLTDGPLKQLTPDVKSVRARIPTPHKHEIKKIGRSPLGLNRSPVLDSSTSSEEYFCADKLNLRAMPNPTTSSSNFKRATGDGLENQNAAENLRISMKKLLHARQRRTGLDQTSSDTESRSSRSDGILTTSNLGERPVSAPFAYLSSDTSAEFKSTNNSANLSDPDPNLADKLSPRAFLSSAFTPLGSVGSAFKKVRSRPLLMQLRSPSAPPIPSYHGDDKEIEEDDIKGIINRFQKDQILDLPSAGGDARLSDDDLERQYMSDDTSNKKRDQETKGSVINTTPNGITKPGVSNSVDKWSKSKNSSLRGKGGRRNTLSQSHESLVVFDQNATPQRLSSANSVNSIVSHVSTAIVQEEVGRVAGWAVNFDKLLKDSSGISVFSDFLKKEYSEENVEFWKTCEDYKSCIDSNFRKCKAAEIYDKYVSVRASDCVNIDSVARRRVEADLENPTPQTFDLAQNQIFQLMKQDSYARFLKSDMYKSRLMAEMEGSVLPGDNNNENTDKSKNADKQAEKDGKKKGKAKDTDEKRRRSLLPWRQKSKKASSKAASESDLKNSKTLKQDKVADDVSAPPKVPTSTSSSELPGVRKDVIRVEPPETITEEPEQPKFCRVIMPDGSTTVVGSKQGQTISYVLGKLCEKRSLSIASVDVFLIGSDKPLNLSNDISTLGSKEVTIERRVLFRMDLPNKKSIGVKAKPNRAIRDVFKPILNKYGFRIDAVDVQLSGQAELLNLDCLVSSIDGQRVMVLTQPTDLLAKNGFGLLGRYITMVRPPLPNILTAPGRRSDTNQTPGHHSDSHSLDEITNQIYGDLMNDKSELAHNFDELGILDFDKTAKVVTDDGHPCLDLSEPARSGQVAVTGDSGRTERSRPRVTFALQKNTARSQTSEEDEALFERLNWAQNQSLDDQRGLAPQDLELPDFLQANANRGHQLQGRESAPAALTRNKGDLQSSQHGSNKSVLNEIDEYIESINENFAAYTREKIPPRQSEVGTSSTRYGTDGRTLQHFTTFGTPGEREKLTYSDKSFSQDGILPDHEDAESLFQSSGRDSPDFTDPHLTDKSLADIGFSYDYNKYLAKSRNFINIRKRPKVPNPPTVPLLVSHETFSPNKTLRNEQLDQSELFDTTLTLSPRSSPYSSDSSLDKENVNRFVPKISAKNIQRTSRNTLIHSPITTQDDDFLSTVDIDSKMVLHSTPKSGSSSGSNAGSMPKTLDSGGREFKRQTGSTNLVHAEPVTFV